MEPSESLLLQCISLPPRGGRNLQSQLQVQMRQAILSGRLAAGVRLPATRSLAQALGISRNTVLAVYEQLQTEGYLQAHGAGGTQVSATAQRTMQPARPQQPADARHRLHPRWQTPAASPPPGGQPPIRIDLRLGQPELRHFPFGTWNRLHARAVRRLGQVPLGYGQDALGHLPLRDMLVQHVSALRAVACTAGDVMVTCGAQQAFDLIARILVTPGRTTVAVEDPGYPLAREAFAAHGARIAGVPVDAQGLVVARIPRQARVVCLTPSHQFPLGVVLSAERRVALLQWAREVDGCIVEDDYDSEFRYGGRSLDALKTLDSQGSVFYVGTFSKTLFPALRIGFVIAPPWARDALARAKTLGDWQCAIHTQETLASFMRDGHLRRHVRKMHRLYEARRDAILQAARPILAPYPSCAGLHVTLELPAGVQDAPVAAALAQRGIAVEALSRYRLDAAGAGALALGFGQADARQIGEAMAAIRQALGNRP